MRRTSTLQAAAAALGLMAGFAMAPQGQAPLDRDVTPYAVALVWRTSGPPELPPVAGVQVDDWGGRLAPAPDRRAAKPRTPSRTPEAKPRAEARAITSPRLRPFIVRGSDLPAATFGVTPRRECPRAEAEARAAAEAREQAEVHTVRHTRHGHYTRQS